MTGPQEEQLFQVKAIGVIHTPFKEPSGTPIQPAFSGETPGEVILFHEYEDALADVEVFERIWLVFWLHRSRPFRLKVVPYLDTQERGLFATRAPGRPNPLGLSAVRLVERRGNILKISGVDMLDKTPLLDIKPYIPRFDSFPGSTAGWIEQVDPDLSLTKADRRFHE